MPPPPSRLTKAEWHVAEMNHEVRDAKRGMDETSCAICMEKLSAGAQVILSCSHVYHSICFNNFERFTKRKMDRCCPLCRCANYQQKKYEPAQGLLRKRSAIRIQTLCRRYQTKVGFQTTLQQHYSSGKGDRSRAHAFFAKRVNKVSAKLVEAMNEKTSQVDALVNESDRALELSRSIFASLDQNPRTNARHQLDESEHRRSGRSEGSPAEAHGGGGTRDGGGGGDNTGTGAFDWPNVRRAAENRGLNDCPICLRKFVVGDDTSTNLAASPQAQSPCSPSVPQSPNLSRTHVSLLSCTHVFHERCIENFENFTQKSGASDSSSTTLFHVVYTCPVCRAGYNRKRLHDIVIEDIKEVEAVVSMQAVSNEASNNME